jgi:ABC-2 type transport system ATP-binding protein
MVFDLVMELKDQGKTIFFCSHILNDVERLCDRIGLMHNGRLIKEFARSDFLPDTANSVFLQTAELSQSQLEKVHLFGVTTRKEWEGHLLAIPEDKYYAVNRYLEESEVEILGCRSEWLSLEDLFMQIVKEHHP